MKRTWVTCVLLMAALCGRARGDERMNGIVGLYYSSYDKFAFEYDLIAQFQKSKDWMGNITGPYVSEEVSLRSNRLGAGMVVGKRMDEKGTFLASVTVFEENRWHAISRFDTGGELRLAFMIFGVKVGLVNGDRKYFEVGLSY